MSWEKYHKYLALFMSKIDTMLLRLMIFRITNVLTMMGNQIVDSITAILPNVCLPNYLLLT